MKKVDIILSVQFVFVTSIYSFRVFDTLVPTNFIEEEVKEGLPEQHPCRLEVRVVAGLGKSRVWKVIEPSSGMFMT